MRQLRPEGGTLACLGHRPAIAVRLLPPLVPFLGDAFEGFATFFVIHEFAALAAAFGFVALGVVARLRVFHLRPIFNGAFA